MSQSAQSKGTVLSAWRWASNAELIEDVAKLGYLDGYVLDTTYGLGTFWKNWMPEEFIGCDLNPDKARDVVADFRYLPFADGTFDAVVMDPPYKLNGTPTDDVDGRYGVDVVSSWQDRFLLIYDGIAECARVLGGGGYLLLKCMDQVCSGKKRWQTHAFTEYANACELTLEDRFDMLVTPRPQPAGRRQVHSQGNYSTLLVFGK